MSSEVCTNSQVNSLNNLAYSSAKCSAATSSLVYYSGTDCTGIIVAALTAGVCIKTSVLTSSSIPYISTTYSKLVYTSTPVTPIVYGAGYVTTKTYAVTACYGTAFTSISSVYLSNTCTTDGKGGSFIEAIDTGFMLISIYIRTY